MSLNPESRILNPLTRYWLLLGVMALAIAGLFSLVLVVARTPALAKLPMFADMFHKALVVHVDLSVLVWFLAIACMLWSHFCPRKTLLPLEEAALGCFALAILAITASAFDPRGHALMSNYIPVITSPIFFIALGLLACGVGLMVVLAVSGRWSAVSEKDNSCLLTAGRWPLQTAALITAIALAAFVWSFMQMPVGYEPQQYFEILFWGGGHVLQFTHVQVMMVCWLMLASSLRAQRSNPAAERLRGSSTMPRLWRFSWIAASAKRPPRNDVLLYVLFSIGLLAALATPYAYLNYPVDSSEHRQFFTHLMIVANGIAPSFLALWILYSFYSKGGGGKNALFSTLFMSLILFLYGGILGGLIQEQNVVIPAHYHGSIVGVTLAFMGAAYLFLPKFGYRDVSAWRLAFWQPIVYGIGQLMHISGLAWSGGYGVLRKTPGGMENLPLDAKAAMGFMGLGGLVAIIGGLMFVVVVWRAVIPSPCRREG